jgi:5'-3' exonuclease
MQSPYQLILLDGTAFLFRAYFSVKDIFKKFLGKNGIKCRFQHPLLLQIHVKHSH